MLDEIINKYEAYEELPPDAIEILRIWKGTGIE